MGGGAVLGPRRDAHSTSEAWLCDHRGRGRAGRVLPASLPRPGTDNGRGCTCSVAPRGEVERGAPWLSVADKPVGRGREEVRARAAGCEETPAHLEESSLEGSWAVPRARPHGRKLPDPRMGVLRAGLNSGHRPGGGNS